MTWRELYQRLSELSDTELDMDVEVEVLAAGDQEELFTSTFPAGFERRWDQAYVLTYL